MKNADEFIEKRIDHYLVEAEKKYAKEYYQTSAFLRGIAVGLTIAKRIYKKDG